MESREGDAVDNEDRSDEVGWSCQHKPRCADAACSHNPAIQAWIKGGRD